VILPAYDESVLDLDKDKSDPAGTAINEESSSDSVDDKLD
jgi:hypothetical protein